MTQFLFSDGQCAADEALNNEEGRKEIRRVISISPHAQSSSSLED